MLRTFYLNWIRGKDKGFVIFKLINTTLGLLCKYVEVIWFFFSGCPPDPEDAGKKVLSYLFILHAKGKFTHNIRSLL